MVRAVFPPCCNEDNGDLLHKVLFMHYHTQCPRPSAGHYRPMPLPGTSGHSKASLGQYFMGSLLLSPGSWYIQSFVCALQESVSQILCKFWWLYGGLNGALLQEGLCHTQVYCTQRPCPCSSPLLADLYVLRRHSNTVLSQSLWGLWVLVHTRYVWTHWASLVGMGFDSNHRWP